MFERSPAAASFKKRGVGYRRVGQPKQNWAIKNLTKASNRIMTSEETCIQEGTLHNLAIPGRSTHQIRLAQARLGQKWDAPTLERVGERQKCFKIGRPSPPHTRGDRCGVTRWPSPAHRLCGVLAGTSHGASLAALRLTAPTWPLLAKSCSQGCARNLPATCLHVTSWRNPLICAR